MPNFTIRLFNSVAYFILIICPFIIIFPYVQCNSPNHSLKCNLNLVEAEVISPYVVLSTARDGPNPEVNQLKLFLNQSSHLDKCPQDLEIYFSAFDKEFVIKLVKNNDLISDRYFENVASIGHTYHNHGSKDADDFHKNHLFLNLNARSNNDHCHYHERHSNSHPLSDLSAISIINGESISGFFIQSGQRYFLDIKDRKTILSKSYDCYPPSAENLPKNWSSKTDSQITARMKRSLPNRLNGRSSNNELLHEPFLSNSSSLYVELLVVHDHSQYMEYKGNASMIAERTMQIVNIMNAFYRQLNIFISLVGVVLWTERDEIKLTEDGDATLTSFLKYRYEKLLPRYHHDNAQLVTSTSFNGSVVGKALKGPICTREHSGGVNTDHSNSPAIVAVTLAHELGHNFGMEHDDDVKCKCPDEKCIMSSSSNSVHPKRWSSCSIEYLESAKKHGLLDCLANKPTKIFGPVCGNGFVEDGEDCDLGEPIPTYGSSKSRKLPLPHQHCLKGQNCDEPVDIVNPCCDRLTCKFVANATCAQGSCCDLTTCSVYKNSDKPRICRPRLGDCDLEEVCDGKSEYCPADVYYHDGIECGPQAISEGSAYDESSKDSINAAFLTTSVNRIRAHCYQGKCSSHDSQCQLLWGPTGYISRDICYEQNLHGNTSGNCGYDRRLKTFESCHQDDSLCGMLHCVHNQASPEESRKPGKLEHGFESASILTVSYFNMSNRAEIFCHGAIIDAGPNVRDPGLVPNGASCGFDKMCVKQKCIPVYDVLYNENWCPSDCNGNGICDNLGRCHCFDGTIGTSCYQFFGANFHLSVILYMILFFVPLVSLVIYIIKRYKSQIKIWWFLHNRKSVLRDKARSHPNAASRRSAAYDADGQKVSISEPRPLNQLNQQVNIPFNYDPFSHDPWATDSNCDPILNGKSPGFRLEPIKHIEPPPTVAPANQQQITRSTTTGNSSVNQTMKPVRAAPHPPKPAGAPSGSS